MALRALQETNQNPAENPELSYYLGLCYTKLENYEEAMLHLEQVVTSSGNIVHIYQSRMILSYIYCITGRFKLAEFELKSLLESGYESAQVYAAFGFVAYSDGRTNDAVEFLQKSISLDPENANALNSLGYILAEEEIDISYAISLCKRAVQLRPENPAYLDSLGWAFYRQGSIKEARSQLRRALNLAGGNREIASHMRAAMSADDKKKR